MPLIKRISRRAVLGGLTALPLRSWAAAGEGRAPQILARDVRNGWGVCGSPNVKETPEAYASMMHLIGTQDLRVYLGIYRATAVDHFRAVGQIMGSAGPRITALVTAYLNDSTTWEQQQRQLLGFAGSGMLRAIEGPNEMNKRLGNGTHGPEDRLDRKDPAEFPANYLAWAKTIDGFAKSNAQRLRGVSIIAPCIASGRQADYASLPDVSAYVDAGNMHYYAGRGFQPSFSMGINPPVGYFDNVRRWAKAAQAPGKPIWMTECGATTSSNYALDGVLAYARDGVSQAKYIANQIFDYFASGGPRMFIYNLLDGNSKAGEPEGNFGLFYQDMTPKPAARMLARLKHILSVGQYDDPRNAQDVQAFTPAYDAGSLVVSGLTFPSQGGPGYLVLPKSDGSTLIALWNEPPIDDGKGQNIIPRDNVVTVDFGSAQNCRIHDLMDDSPPHRMPPGRVVNVTLRGYPMLVELSPPGRN